MIITIARQCGCQAKAIGRLLAQKYGLTLYTRQNLLQIAKERGTLAEMDDFFREYPVDDLINAISLYTEEHDEVQERFCRSFNNIIGQEHCIIIGRCGNHIFRHRDDLVSIFLHGDLQRRILNIAENKSISLNEAADFVEDIDEQRAVYHKYYTGLTWGNSADYDLSLDSCRLGVENSARIIEEYINLSVQRP